MEAIANFLTSTGFYQFFHVFIIEPICHIHVDAGIESQTGSVFIVFRHSLALPMGERPTLAQAASMIDAAIEASDRYYPAFDFMVRGNKKPQEAIDACLFETVGTA